jgi:MinD superfamily P-loop ATPase
MQEQRSTRKSLTHGQMLRKLQLAVDHIAAVTEATPLGASELSEALDLVHHAESEIEDDRDAS